MKVIKKILLFLIILTTTTKYTLKVQATENANLEKMNIDIVGDTTFEKNIELSVEINNLEEYEGFYGMTASLEYDKDKLELTRIKGENNFEIYYNGEAKEIVLYNPKGIKTNTKVLSLRFQKKNLKKDEDTTIKISNITASDSNKDIKLLEKEKIIKTITEDINNTSNSNLSSITINGKELKINKDELIYDITVDYQTSNITIDTKHDKKTKITSGDGTHQLEVGSNEIEINTIDEEGTEKTYLIDVTREGKKENNNNPELFINSSNKSNKNLKKSKYIVAFIIIILTMIIIKKRKDRR